MAEIINMKADGSFADDGAGLIKDTTTADFMTDVMEASQTTPVLVDFWAPWCGPCRQLGPVIEKVVKSFRGAVRLVKMNIDEHPEIPGQLGVQSIPAVFAFKQGQPVDGFMGAVPESQIRSFIEKLLGPDGLAHMAPGLDEARALLAEGQATEAAGVFSQLLSEDGEDLDAMAGLAEALTQLGEFDKADGVLAMAPASAASNSALKKARATLELARKAGDTGDIAGLEAELARAPDNPQTMFDLAMAVNQQGDHARAADLLLDMMKKHRDWNDGAAQQQLLQFFEAWGPADKATLDGRRKLSSLLFS